jgi:hypothetical protein
MWRTLREQGHSIISSWIDEAGPGESPSREDLINRCLQEASSAERIIWYVEATDFPFKLAWGEICVGLFSGVPVFIVAGEDVTDDMLAQLPQHHRVLRCATIEEALVAVPRPLAIKAPGALAIPCEWATWEQTRFELEPHGYTWSQGCMVVPPCCVPTTLLQTTVTSKEVHDARYAIEHCKNPIPKPWPSAEEAVAEFTRLAALDAPTGRLVQSVAYAERFGFGLTDRVPFLTGRGVSTLRKRVQLLHEGERLLATLAAR